MDKRFLKESGLEAFTGNELILKGALEGGAALLTGYPGSPVSDVFDAVEKVADVLVEKGVVAQMANNEALSAARLNGARMADLRALTVMKSVGMHVAADGLAIGNLAEPHKPAGGAVVVVGDDPWNETTQINSDSRFLSRHLHMPVLEPSTFQEIKDWIKDGFELSGLSDLYVTYLITTNQADGGATVTCRPNIWPTINRKQHTALSGVQFPVENMVMIPPHTSLREATLSARHQRIVKAATARGLNKIYWDKPGEKFTVGFISSGLTFCYLSQALEEMGLGGRFPVLKWGMTYPLDEDLLLDFARRVDHVYVVEEKRDFLESQTVGVFQRAYQEGRLPKMPAVWGKYFPEGEEGFPSARGLNSSVVVERLAPLVKNVFLPADASRAEDALKTVRAAGEADVKIPTRTPTFCPGCPHRDSSVVTKAIKTDFLDADYMKSKYSLKPMEVLFHGESGCHSMLQFEPNLGLMQNYSGMGLGGGTGAGIDPFIDNKQVVFLGDSTFFHSGMLAVSDAIKNNQDITFIILDNKTTAMTGHQPTPGNDTDVLGRPTFAQDIEQVIGGLSKNSIPLFRVNPAYRDSYRSLVEEIVLKKGVKVVIADKECAITLHRRLRREDKKVLREKGFLPEKKFINITPEVCENCLECASATGCPGLAVEETLHGPKIATDLSLCVSDGACAKGKVCPSFEEVTVRRSQAPAPLPSVPTGSLPVVAPRSFDDVWFCYTAAVGGMGAGVVTGILVQAGFLEGHHVLFADKKGLAIRNGGVYGHVIFSKTPKILAPLVPYGRADVLLGLDILESVRSLDPKINLRVAGPRTAVVVNTHKMPTVKTLMGKDDFDTPGLEDILKSRTRRDAYLGQDFAAISEEYFGTKLYSNVLLLGAAFQKGLLPLSLENITAAVRMMVPSSEKEENLRAFDLGRQAAASPNLFARFSPRLPGYWDVLEDKTVLLRRSSLFFGRRISREYRKMTEEAARWIDLEDPLRAKLAQYIYDLIRFEGLGYARRYLQKLWSVYKKDNAGRGLAATRAVLENLYRVMIIKDEIYVAHLLTSEEKRRRDRDRYRVDLERGDKIEYVHLNRPHFRVFGKSISFDLRGRDWQLQIMKRLKFLRKWPEWHAREKAFRFWYENLVEGFTLFAHDDVYRAYVEALRLPDGVTGYREIRYPKMDDARRKAEEILSRVPRSSSEKEKISLSS